MSAVELTSSTTVLYDHAHTLFITTHQRILGQGNVLHLFVILFIGGGGGGDWLPNMHYRSHDQHPGGGGLPSVHHRSHYQRRGSASMEVLHPGGGGSAFRGWGSASRGEGWGLADPPSETRKAGASYRNASLLCYAYTSSKNLKCNIVNIFSRQVRRKLSKRSYSFKMLTAK